MKKVFFNNSDERLPINTIFCIGRNYAEHAAELHNPLPGAPIIFIKPLTTIIYDGESIELPAVSREVHHEVEMVALIGKSGKHIAGEEALGYIRGYGIGIDVTARDIQQIAKAKSHPWTVAKGFDTFAPISSFVEATQVQDPSNLSIELAVNGEIRQSGNTRDMIFPLADLIAYLSSVFTLSPGDLIFTGTPQGVGPIRHGDRLEAVMGGGLASLTVTAERRNFHG